MRLQPAPEFPYDVPAAPPVAAKPEMGPPAKVASPPTAEQVVQRAVQIVTTDKVFMARAHDPRFEALGSLAGSVRNLLSMLAGRDTSRPEVAAHACTGIAARAVFVLQGARSRGALPGVQGVKELERRSVPGRSGPLDAYHTAVALTLNDGRVLVLDWHATLSARAPEVQTPEDF